MQSARFFIVDPEGRASVAATLLPGAGGVQQEKLLLRTNKFCGRLDTPRNKLWTAPRESRTASRSPPSRFQCHRKRDSGAQR
ncbi:hypothetical protein DYL59_21565 [Pseudomonas kairouanensis]|uniref:Uncharacterized protein n=1 Tax=Pseudomonas kairouanensis TaxID=2293832 RepID=A0A4Z0AIE5_9PSED|nr:hypothetical protein DYL59_21565 [Pseudomonas kairouanensis]